MMLRSFKHLGLILVALLAMAIVGNVGFAQPDANEALKQAIISGDLSAVKQAVAHGADVNFKGARPLYMAAGKGQLEIAKYLISAGANVNGVMTYGQVATPLRVAAGRALYTNKYKLVEYLLSFGADPAIGGTRRHSPLTAAVMTGHLDQVKKIVSRGNVEFEFKEWDAEPGDGLGKTALMIAALRGFAPIVEYLVVKGANVNTSHKCARTALNYAVASGSTQIVKYLVEHGAEVDPKMPKGCIDPVHPSPLLDATDRCDGEMLSFLLDLGAQYNLAAERAESECQSR